jgi:hypothetical protein
MLINNLRTLKEENDSQISASLFVKGEKKMLRICPVFQYRKAVRTPTRKNKNAWNNMSSFSV